MIYIKKFDNEEEMTTWRNTHPNWVPAVYRVGDEVFFISDKPTLVDLGLSVKWGDRNVGAKKAEDYGKYFAWGDTTGMTMDEIYSSGEEVTGYTRDESKDLNVEGVYCSAYTKDNKIVYAIDNIIESHKYCGVLDTEFNVVSYKYAVEEASLTYYAIDNTLYTKDWYNGKGLSAITSDLALEQDAARVILGGDWRMPTSAECKELLTATTPTVETINGISGTKFTASNGNYIFIPFAGHCIDGGVYGIGSYSYCWSSSFNDSDSALYLDCDNDGGRYVLNYNRYYGYSVRGVA